MSLKKLALKFLIIFSSLVLFCPWALAKSTKPTEEIATPVKQTPPPIDFFTPGISDPGALIAFGENILPQGQTKIGLFADDYAGPGFHYIDLFPSILYGLTDRLSLLLNTPYALSYQNDNTHSSGIEDIFTQLEYAYYLNSTDSYQEQATILGNISLPTGDNNAEPPIGNGSITYFFGTTYNRTYLEWFVFLSPGASITTTSNGSKNGNKYLYQLGFGRNIAEIGNKWIFAFVTEFDGAYTSPNTENGVTTPDTGGNTVLLTPSLSLSGKQLSLQAGVGIPIVQNLFGQQTRTNYLLAANISWLFLN